MEKLRVSVKLDKELHQKLAAFAKRKGPPIGWYLDRLVERFLRNKEA